MTCYTSEKNDSAHVVADLPALRDILGLVDWTGRTKDNVGHAGRFSATQQIESDIIRVLNNFFVHSAAQITECDSNSYGCNGGYTESAFKYVQKPGGLESDADYPDGSALNSSGSGTCTMSSNRFNSQVTISGCTALSGEDTMASYVQSAGPHSICVDASNLELRIMKSCGQSIDHCVQAVGVKTHSHGYWKIRRLRRIRLHLPCLQRQDYVTPVAFGTSKQN